MNLGIVITVLSVIASIVCGVMTGMGVELAFKLLLFFGIWLIGGLNIMAVGVVGAYTGKIYLESKARPRFIIEKFINEE